MKRVASVAALGACAMAGLALALTGNPAPPPTSGTSSLVGNRVIAQAAPALSNPAQLRKAQLAALGSTPRDGMTTRNGSGWLRSFNRSGAIDTDNAFFHSLGSNGRSCDSCHRLEAAWSITPPELRARFTATGGTDPIFRRNDGSNSPNADVSTVGARRLAYSMLLTHGVIRVGLPIPANAEFVLDAVDDPYGFASSAELSLFRRPLPSTNLSFLTGVMWDARETATPFLPPMHAGQNHTALVNSLIHQVVSATVGHAEGLDPTDAQMADIVVFETGLTTAQIRDDVAGYLNDADAIGGPRVLAQQRFHIGINDTLGGDPTGASFEPDSMSLFRGWADREGDGKQESARLSIARGERLFNDKPINISGVGGLNDALGAANIVGTCTTCHNSPNVGNHSVALPLNIGLADASRRTPDMPLYILRQKTTNAIVRTTDPGLALVTGKWKDIGRFKGPILRGLAARPPYFHNGFAASLEDVVEFYDTRFNMNLTQREKADMAAFLRSL